MNELQKLEQIIVLHDRWIRALRTWKEEIAAGTTIKGSAIPVIPTVSAPSVGAVTKWENASGAQRDQGTVVIQNGDRTFGVTNVVDDADVIGVLDEDAIAVGEDGKVRHVGYQSVVNVQGNVTAGHYLRTSTTAGRAEDAGTAPTPGTFAIALTAYAGGGAGTVAAYLDVGLQLPAHGPNHQSGGTDAIKLDDLASPDDNTDLDASIAKHGLLAKLPNDATKFLDGTGAFDTIAVGDLPSTIKTRRVEMVLDASAASTTEPKFVVRVPAGTIANVYAKLGNDETCGATSLILDLHKITAANANADGQGTTVYTTQANRPTISNGNMYTAAAAPDVTSLAVGDWLAAYVDQVGTDCTVVTLVVEITLS